MSSQAHLPRGAKREQSERGSREARSEHEGQIAFKGKPKSNGAEKYSQHCGPDHSAG